MARKTDPKDGKEVVILSPSIVKINGKLFYSESAQCWNILRLKRAIFHEYPQLKDRSGDYGYTMILSKSRDKFKDALDEMDEEAVPILLVFNKNGKEAK